MVPAGPMIPRFVARPWRRPCTGSKTAAGGVAAISSFDAFRARWTRIGPAQPEAAMSCPFNREAGDPHAGADPDHARNRLPGGVDAGAWGHIVPPADVAASRVVSGDMGARMGWRVG